ncbi:MAG: DUF3536 domain-containing protein [Elusimicrobia bacterium]|nr:DUF3536 domain-containing protein [Elusimicrobiota bacterium]
MTRYLCIHGHFYQPPRENPWLEEVEPEDSAHPFRDWNTRILHECYGPNTASPILKPEGPIVEFLNNFEWISFNFGPTLLSWLERHAPKVYQRILKADQVSLDRLGHGNAMAQVYNHTIMPLATSRDKRTQIRWGIQDFQYRFRRPPEGMWLAETAVDEETLEILAEEGIQFTILSPDQARLPMGSKELDTFQAYRWSSKKLNNRFLNLFFYHKELSHAIAFEGILSDGERFNHRLLASFKKTDAPQLLHMATDGESYGHHHRFGNMALSYVLRKIRSESSAEIINYGAFLEKYPPQKEMDIHPQTAWSCSHGVGRWQEDCGCRIGSQTGWNQKWRKPLREALNWLAQELDKLHEELGKPLLKDPWAARDHYIERLLDPSPLSTKRFLHQHSRKHLSAEESETAIRLLEMQKARLLMFTSCGWFFDEISGLESVQVLKYAARGIEIASWLRPERPLEPPFGELLKKCPSNLEAFKDGHGVYSKLIVPQRTNLKRAAAHYAIESTLEEIPKSHTRYAFHHRSEIKETSLRPHSRLCLFWTDIHRPNTLEKEAFTVAVIYRGKLDLECFLKANPDPEEHRKIAKILLKEHAQKTEMEFLQILKTILEAPCFGFDVLFSEEKRKMIRFLTPPASPERQEFQKTWIQALRNKNQTHPLHLLLLLKKAKEMDIPWSALPLWETGRAAFLEFCEKVLCDPFLEELPSLLQCAALYKELDFPEGHWEMQSLVWEKTKIPDLEKWAREKLHDHQKIASS